jgi:cation diffusion facilitator family transporter
MDEAGRMHQHSIENFGHDHAFLGKKHERNERRILLVVGLTAIMMVVEIAGGAIYHSMALIADGWHMATHAGALGISALAYAFARRFKDDRRFAFGTGKVGDLAAFASAVVLVVIALLIAYESMMRLAEPVAIAYGEATAIAIVGLVVNLVSAWLLVDGDGHHTHHHGDGAHHEHHSHAHGRDNNMRAAFLHVVADAATSVAAILGLIAAKTFGLAAIDPLVALAGTAVILVWAIGLLRDSGAVLLDVVPDHRITESIRRRLESADDQISDLHLWQVGPGHRAAVIALVSQSPQDPSAYKDRLADIEGLCHVTVEVSPRR